MSDGYDHIPVLPGEATDLNVHVDQCAKRYSALLRYNNDIMRQIRAGRLEAWLYRTFTVSALSAGTWYLSRVAEALSSKGLLP